MGQGACFLGGGGVKNAALVVFYIGVGIIVSFGAIMHINNISQLMLVIIVGTDVRLPECAWSGSPIADFVCDPN